MKAPMKTIFFAACAAVLVVSGIGEICLSARAADSQKAGTAQVIAPRVTVASAQRREVVETVTATGTLVPRQEVLVGPEIDGLRILELLADMGDQVKKGQVLVRLSRETLDAQVAQSDAALSRTDAAIAQAKSQIRVAEANAKFTVSELARAQQLVQRGASTRAVLDQKLSASNTASAQLQVAKDALQLAHADKKAQLAQRRELMVRVSRTEIKAPAAGLISERTAKIGALVAGSGQPLFRIIKDGKIELDGEVTEQRLLAIRTGNPARIMLANGDPIKGRVRLISPQVDPVSRLGHVRIALDDNNNIARSGAFARAIVEIRRSNSVTVPASAVLYDGVKVRVQVVDGKLVRARPVQLGLVSGEFAEILKGLEPGEKVVLRAGSFLRDGDEIAPVSQQVGTR